MARAFRSEGIAAGLFNAVIEDDLDRLTARKGNPQRCRELQERFRHAAPGVDALHRDNLKDAFGDTARSVMRISVMQQELRSAGCDADGGGAFRPVEEQMMR